MTESPLQEGLCLILHCVEPGKKGREIVIVNKLHFCLGTNEIIKYMARAQRDMHIGSLKEFVSNYRFNDQFIEGYGAPIDEFLEIQLFESTDGPRKLLVR